MRNKKIDVLCLQETGNLFETEPESQWGRLNNGLYYKDEYLGTQSRSPKVRIYYTRWQREYGIFHLAILVNLDVFPNNPVAFIPFAGCRPIMGIIIQNQIAIYNIHAPVCNCTFDYISSTITEIVKLMNDNSALIKYFILVGDFNYNPYELLKKTDFNVCHPHTLTHQKTNILDYCVTTLIPKKIVVEQITYSDHFPVIFDFV